MLAKKPLVQQAQKTITLWLGVIYLSCKSSAPTNVAGDLSTLVNEKNGLPMSKGSPISGGRRTHTENWQNIK